ncbi:hypothetical protein BDN67DRAFT_984852 [Paxillus ammoniavirescens]|nr:hypothetical protein BDN67DRAFT_984852 [Paxillus ammoniavirescens]
MGDVDGVRCQCTGLGALRPRSWWLWDTPPVALCRFHSIQLIWEVINTTIQLATWWVDMMVWVAQCTGFNSLGVAAGTAHLVTHVVHSAISLAGIVFLLEFKLRHHVTHYIIT